MPKKTYAGLVYRSVWSGPYHRALFRELVSLLLRGNLADYLRLYGHAAKIESITLSQAE